MKNKLKKVWCFPQDAIGFILKKVTKARKVGSHYEYDVKCGSVSLGDYIFLSPSDWHDETALRHEQGHQKQSLYLGWLYIFVVGIPSLIWAGCFKSYRRKNNISYYSFYTEAWADKLMNIQRYQE